MCESHQLTRQHISIEQERIGPEMPKTWALSRQLLQKHRVVEMKHQQTRPVHILRARCCQFNDDGGGLLASLWARPQPVMRPTRPKNLSLSCAASLAMVRWRAGLAAVERRRGAHLNLVVGAASSTLAMGLVSIYCASATTGYRS